MSDQSIITELTARAENGAFCVLPWIHDYRTLSGDKYACCVSHTDKIPLDPRADSEKNQQFRQDLWTGVRRAECGACHRMEDRGMVSYRQSHNQQWLTNARVQQHMAAWVQDPSRPPTLLYYDLRYDSKCNLSCITCGPEFSTLWKRELGIPITDYQLSVNRQEVLAAEKIYFAGGEPLIIDQYTDLLRYLAANDFAGEVSINTNLTSLRPDVLDSIQAIGRISLVVSVDAYGTVDEYVRYPKQWSKFINNLEMVQSAGIAFNFNSVASAISVLGWDRLPELDQYGPDHWFLFALQLPPELQIQNLPAPLKLRARSNIEHMMSMRYYQQDRKFGSVIDTLLKELDTPGEPARVLGRIAELDARRRIDHADYIGVNLMDYKE